MRCDPSMPLARDPAMSFDASSHSGRSSHPCDHCFLTCHHCSLTCRHPRIFARSVHVRQRGQVHGQVEKRCAIR